MHLESVAIIVKDYDAAIAFFVDLVGFELIEDSPSFTNAGGLKRWVVVRPPGATTGVLLAQADGDTFPRRPLLKSRKSVVQMPENGQYALCHGRTDRRFAVRE